MKRLLKILAVFAFSMLAVQAIAQEEEENIWEDLLYEEVEVENPVYKPVIGIGAGVLSFYGDLNTDFNNLIQGRPAFKVNVATFLDKDHYFTLNFFFLNGELFGQDYNTYINETGTRLGQSRNFQSTLFGGGINIHYEFDHFRNSKKKVSPFISVGFENIQFNNKTNLLDGNGNPYYYWGDGTVRNISEQVVGQSSFITLDNDFESDLRALTEQTYNLNTFAIPIDLGLDFAIGDRATFRIATSFHYTLTDYIDNLSSESVVIQKPGNDATPAQIAAYNNWNGAQGDAMNDGFFFTYFTVHVDLWSDPETITVRNLFAEVDYDYDLLSDADNDFVFDLSDECPDTPLGTEVDSVGCPFDDDLDNVPNYMDKELNTPQGSIVDENGVALDDDQLAQMLDMSDAVRRTEIYDLPMDDWWSKYGRVGSVEIPAKFKHLDRDGDSYISYEELMRAIDGFFEDNSQLQSDDIYELNEFFFRQ